MNSELDAALQMHKRRRFADAARRYDALLRRQPRHADALHLFGVLHHQSGYSTRAVELIEAAVLLRPDAAAYHCNLAEAHRALGEHHRAAACCRKALELRPHYPEAANNLGLTLQALGQYPEAAEQFRAALRMRPDFAMAQNNLGVLLRELGQVDEALEAFRAAVALDPDLAMACANLGQLLLDRGEAEEALVYCKQAVRAEPTLPAGHNNLGNALRALERFDEARAAYAEALRLAPELARAHANLGLCLQLEGKHAQALDCLRQAVACGPDDFDMWQTLANAHALNEDFAAAIPCCERLIALKPGLALGHNEFGWAQQQQGRPGEAAACYARALELQPDQLDATLSQGSLHEELGDLSEAEACYRRARAVHPAAPGPLAHLATLLRGKLPDGDRQALQQRLDGPMADGPRSALLFGLAQVHDARGEYAEAAACLAQANALALKVRRKEGKFYEPQAHNGLVDRILAGFTPELFGRLAGAGDPTRLPVFVFGMPRSGTTLVEQILSSHSQVHGAGELGLAREVFQSVPAVLGMADEMATCLRAVNAPAVRKLGARYLEGLRALAPAGGAERLVDKMPDNYLYVGLLAMLFPQATFVHVRRDLRDVAVSCWMTHFSSIRWANDAEHLAARCREYRRVMAHWQAVLPVPVHEVVYERLVDDFEAEARQLVRACGLEWEPACLRFHQTARPVRTASVTQVRQPLYRRAVARWKNYEDALADLFARLGTD
jgi:tetratricopeptide (TPR) repeat protein